MSDNQDNLVSVYIGTDITANVLKEYLSEIDVLAILNSEHDSSIDKTGDCEVLVFEHDVDKAMPLVEEFKKNNPQD